MKTLVLYTALLLSLPLAFASHIAPMHRRGRHLRRSTCPSVLNSNSSNTTTTTTTTTPNPPSSGCFPSLGFQMPSNVPSTINAWWCNMNSEYAFLGFSYEVTACQSLSQLQKEFLDIRNRFKGRYVRLYGACDRSGFYDDIVNAAWDAGVGVHALIWFGFDGSNIWQARRDSLFSTLENNPKAKFVTRAVQFGSEPLFDKVLSPASLTTQVDNAKATLAALGILVTVSDMAYGYQSNGGAQDVLNAIDFVDAHILPFFSAQYLTGASAWPFVQTNMNWFINNASGKKIIFSENGWPSQQTADLHPNNLGVVASVWNMQEYFHMLDSHCTDLKWVAGGGVGWFFHIYSDSMELGYGLLDTSGNAKFAFAPQTSC